LRATPWLLWLLAGAAFADTPWSDWDRFADRFIEPNGRVVDRTFDSKTTSEGQSYGLFFALVADRRDQFDAILSWTSDNLAKGQLGHRLPAWSWGRTADGQWRVKDENSAADADLWIAYTLFEAARLWQEPRYAEIATQLLKSIRRNEVASLGGDTAILLPGTVGFEVGNGRFRIDPSYLPGFLFRYLAGVDPKGPWQNVWDTYARMMPVLFPHGIATDLATVDGGGRVFREVPRDRFSSYDAIRVYLWAGMSADDGVVRLLEPYADVIRRYGAPPERVDATTGAAQQTSYFPIGFSGAVLPFLQALGDHETVATQRNRLEIAATADEMSKRPTNYYDQALILFGTGWLDGRYRFDGSGRVVPIWQR
jgi:endoglucanase